MYPVDSDLSANGTFSPAPVIASDSQSYHSTPLSGCHHNLLVYYVASVNKHIHVLSLSRFSIWGSPIGSFLIVRFAFLIPFPVVFDASNPSLYLSMFSSALRHHIVGLAPSIS
jgi:hypothetical protein